jgi:hypothetical protein
LTRRHIAVGAVVATATFGPSGYDYRFRPAVGSFTDSGSATCHEL